MPKTGARREPIWLHVHWFASPPRHPVTEQSPKCPCEAVDRLGKPFVLAHPLFPFVIYVDNIPLLKNSDDLMARGALYTIFRRPQFCCCFPVRACVIIMSVLGILLGGLLSIICWFQVSRTYPKSFPLTGAVLINPRWGRAYKQAARGLYWKCNR